MTDQEKQEVLERAAEGGAFDGLYRPAEIEARAMILLDGPLPQYFGRFWSILWHRRPKDAGWQGYVDLATRVLDEGARLSVEQAEKLAEAARVKAGLTKILSILILVGAGALAACSAPSGPTAPPSNECQIAAVPCVDAFGEVCLYDPTAHPPWGEGFRAPDADGRVWFLTAHCSACTPPIASALFGACEPPPQVDMGPVFRVETDGGAS